MKKVILSAYVILASFAVLNAQAPVPAPMPSSAPLPGSSAMPVDPAAPKAQNIEFVQFKEISYDFGNLRLGSPASHTFEFKNVGNRDITIDNVNASCGCTTPNWKGGIYKPTETGQITATYNAASVGGFTKNVTVTSSEGSIVLTITGTVLDGPAYDEWKAKKDAEDALKAQEEASKSKSKTGSKTKPKANTNQNATKPKATTKGS